MIEGHQTHTLIDHLFDRIGWQFGEHILRSRGGHQPPFRVINRQAESLLSGIQSRDRRFDGVRLASRNRILKLPFQIRRQPGRPTLQVLAQHVLVRQHLKIGRGNRYQSDPGNQRED